MNYLVIVAFVAIVGSLVAALVYMMKGSPSAESEDGQTQAAQRAGRMAKALALRVGLSILLFSAVLFSYWMGWIQPTGIANGR
jgi:hypothetical protein